MYSENLYKKAVSYFSEMNGVNIENEHVKKYAEELCYCYVQEKDLMSFDFWTRYEELLGEKLSYQEFLAIDNNFDLDPHDVSPEDNAVLDAWEKGWLKSLAAYREKQKEVASITVHELVKTHEDGDGIREFEVAGSFLDKDSAKDVFIKERIKNEHFETNGVFSESDGYICSEYKDGNGFSSLELVKKEIGFTKEQLKTLLACVDKELLYEILPEEFSNPPLYTFIEEEVPFRLEEIYDIPLTNEVKDELVDYLYAHTDILFDYDRLDMYLLNKHEELIKDQLISYDAVIVHLCEVLNNADDHWGVERKTEEFHPVFESEDYYGIYFYNGENEYYLVNKDTGKYNLVLADTPEFVGKYTLGMLDEQKEIRIEDAEIFGWLVKYSRENITDFSDYWTDDRTKGLQVLEQTLAKNLLANALDLLKEGYTGMDFDAWAENEILVSQENHENALYNALVLLEERYEGNEEFVSWAENEIGVSKDVMKKIGFLEAEKAEPLSLDMKMAKAKDRTEPHAKGTKKELERN